MQVIDQPVRCTSATQRRREVGAGGEEVLDLAEDPRPALRRAADHQGIGAGGAQHFRAFSGEVMSPLATTGTRTAAFTAAIVSYSAWPL